MDVKSFLINDMQAEKDGYIAMIRNNEMSEDEKKVINQKIDALDERIAKAKNLENDNALELEKKLKEMNSKFDALKEKVAQKGVKIEGIDNSNYLSSQNAVDDFAECLRKASKEKSFNSLWKEKLVKNDISMDDNSSAFIPTPVATYIADTWEKEAGAILREFRFVGVPKMPVVINVSSQNAPESRARGHQKGETKQEQTIELINFEIDTQYVYKLQKIYNKMVFTSNGALIQYVIDELMTQWFYEVLRAILVGDGRTDTTHITSIVAITDLNTAHSNTNFVKTADAPAGETVLEYMMDKVIAPIENGDNDILLFVSKADYQQMRKFINGNGATPTYMNEAQLASAMGVRRIVIVDYIDNTTSAGVRAIAVHANRYGIIGSLNPEFISWEDYMTNDRMYRVEMLVGGDALNQDVAVVAYNA